MIVELITVGDEAAKDAVLIHVLTPKSLDDAVKDLSQSQRNWLDAGEFAAKPGQTALIPSNNGMLDRVFFGAPKQKTEQISLFFAKLVSALPSGIYRFSEAPENEVLVALSWLLGCYRFDKYLKEKDDKTLSLVVSNDDISVEAQRMAEATNLVRDLINTPTNDMGPAELSSAAQNLAVRYDADFHEILGDDLIKENFPLIHAVGRASESAPRLIDLRWGQEGLPKITLVGKGVCFDTGGLNIKTGNFMTLMKKDMGGAANVLGLAQLIMDAALPVRLRVLIPAVENSISGNAFRPGDILPSRLGLNVEISNTDAEGRLVLADALALADEEEPDVLIDMATLTGAARVALGPDLPPFYTNDDAFADELAVRARDAQDPLWRMPLWEPYQTMLDTPIADVNHASTGGFAGSVTAALFLSRFVKSSAIWGHFDVYGWAPTTRAIGPKGGEAQAIRALYGLLKARYSDAE